MSTKWVGNDKKKKVKTGLRAECSLLEKESGDGHSFLLICFFFFCWIFIILFGILIFLFGFCYDFVGLALLLSRVTIFVKYNYLFISLWLGSPTAG